MERDAIDFGSLKVSVLFRRLFIPTLCGMLSISAVTVADGIFVAFDSLKFQCLELPVD